MDRTARPRAASRARRWALAVAVLFMAGLGMVLLFLLTLATRNRNLYEQNYQLLLGINLAVAALLLGIIVWFGLRLSVRLRQRKFGSRLLLKIAAIFALVGIVPGLLIYTVSYQFVSRSIESWFDVRVESALGAGLNLGRTTFDTLQSELATKVRAAAAGLSGSGEGVAAIAVDRLREQLLATQVALWSDSGPPLASAGEVRFSLNPDRPSAPMLRRVRAERVVTALEGLEDFEAAMAGPQAPDGGDAAATPRLRAIASVPAASLTLGDQSRYLDVIVPLPRALVVDALAVQAANREYQERALAREGLRRMYIGTLTLTLFLAVFGAVLLAVLLGNQLVRPLLVLAEGMRDVARGDLTPKAALPARDELAGLTRTFADMTRELADARQTAQQSLQELDAARDNLQTILDNLTAGVLVLDADGCIVSANPGAARILRASLAPHMGEPLASLPGLQAFAQAVQRQFDRHAADAGHHDGGNWQQSFELQASEGARAEGIAGRGAGAITLIARGALLPAQQRLLVFDDISEVISAQRTQAWGEVARRLAHEIKNPLTPIQLSAERLAMKLEGKLADTEQALLDKSVRTIVDQVDAMKRLVNEFRDYARLPAAQLAPIDLNACVSDVLALYDPATTPVRVELDAACPQVMADPQQVRQVLHNLVQNAIDAQESAGAPPGTPVHLQTRRSDSGRWVRLVVSDSGGGFADAILQRAFEPYVTTKAKGTGLGLAVVKKIMDDHGGRVDIANRVHDGQVTGAQVSLSFAVAASA